MPLTEDSGRQLAEILEMELGTPFASSDWPVKGLFTFTGGAEAGQAYFGTSGSKHEMWVPLEGGVYLGAAATPPVTTVNALAGTSSYARPTCNPTNRTIECGWSEQHQLCVRADAPWNHPEDPLIIHAPVNATNISTRYEFHESIGHPGACNASIAQKEADDRARANAKAAEEAAAAKMQMSIIVAVVVALLLSVLVVLYKRSTSKGHNGDRAVSSFENPQYADPNAFQSFDAPADGDGGGLYVDIGTDGPEDSSYLAVSVGPGFGGNDLYDEPAFGQDQSIEDLDDDDDAEGFGFHLNDENSNE